MSSIPLGTCTKPSSLVADMPRGPDPLVLEGRPVVVLDSTGVDALGAILHEAQQGISQKIPTTSNIMKGGFQNGALGRGGKTYLWERSIFAFGMELRSNVSGSSPLTFSFSRWKVSLFIQTAPGSHETRGKGSGGQARAELRRRRVSRWVFSNSEEVRLFWKGVRAYEYAWPSEGVQL